MQSTGRVIYSGGGSTIVGGQLQEGAYRVLENGDFDSSFRVGSKLTASQIILLSGDKLLIRGELETFAGEVIDGVFRLNQDGNLDESFSRIELNFVSVSVFQSGEILGVVRNESSSADLYRYSAEGALISRTTFPDIRDSEPSPIPWDSASITTSLQDSFITGSSTVGVVENVVRTTSSNRDGWYKTAISLLDEEGNKTASVDLGGFKSRSISRLGRDVVQFVPRTGGGAYLTWRGSNRYSGPGMGIYLENGDLEIVDPLGDYPQIIPVTPSGVLVAVEPDYTNLHPLDPIHPSELLYPWKLLPDGSRDPSFSMAGLGSLAYWYHWKRGTERLEIGYRLGVGSFTDKIVNYDDNRIIVGSQRFWKVSDSALPPENLPSKSQRDGEAWGTVISLGSTVEAVEVSGISFGSPSINFRGSTLEVSVSNAQGGGDSASVETQINYQVSTADGRTTRFTEALTLTKSAPWFKSELPGEYRIGIGNRFEIRISGYDAIGGTRSTYQWYFEGLPIGPESSNPDFVPQNPATLDDAGTYHVVVTNEYGQIVSDAIEVEVVLAPISGIYLGDITNSNLKVGSSGVYLNSDGGITLGVSLPDEGIAFVEQTVIEEDGSFSVTLEKETNDDRDIQITVSGHFSGLEMNASIAWGDSEANIRLTGTPITSGSAGYIPADLLGTNTGEVHIFYGDASDLFAMIIRDSDETGAEGAFNSDRSTYSVITAEGLTIQGSLNSADGTSSGALIENAIEVAHYMGLRDDLLPSNRLINLSRRGRVISNSNPVIVGFALMGDEPKELLLRAAGPKLGDFGISDPLANPYLNLFTDGDPISNNDNWGDASNADEVRDVATRVGAFSFDEGSNDSSILTTLEPGAYTAHVGGFLSTGTTLVDMYDASDASALDAVKLVNLSTRGIVSETEGVLIAGFVITGNKPTKVLIRAAGSTLEQWGISNYLTDPKLSVFEEGRLIVQNDDWGDYGEELISAAAAQVGAFPFVSSSNESAVLLTLPPGIYTAHADGVSGASGETLVEVYAVE